MIDVERRIQVRERVLVLSQMVVGQPAVVEGDGEHRVERERPGERPHRSLVLAGLELRASLRIKERRRRAARIAPGQHQQQSHSKLSPHHASSVRLRPPPSAPVRPSP